MKEQIGVECSCGGYPNIVVNFNDTVFVATCSSCKRQTTELSTPEEAINAWNLQMKKKVGVDMSVGESETVEGVYMRKEEYERLRRLDENVKSLIEALGDGLDPICYRFIETLRSLYDL